MLILSISLENLFLAIKSDSCQKIDVYLSVLPGELLTILYEEYGPKLLERNVRSFLQFRGNANKGIRQTLINEPEMFLAYNNGLTITAQSVVERINENGVSEINEIRDMQIVNGGQTTAALYRAYKDKTLNVNFPKVFVQMKLSVISKDEDMDEIIPNISKYSNTQNTVQLADFSSNEPYHRKMEQLSRQIWGPSINGSKPINWFYERARGQYSEEMSKYGDTPAKQKEFKETHYLVTKTDLAKVLFSWDMKPEIVSLGAQKCFAQFMDQMKKGEPIVATVDYYHHFIAKVILFRRIEKLVLAQKFGGYKANIVAYTFFKLMKLTNQRIDLEEIWKKQSLTVALENAITEICIKVQNLLINYSGGANVGEFCKAKRCVDLIDAMEYELPSNLISELLNKPLEDDLIDEGGDSADLTLEQRETLNKVKEIEPQEWKEMAEWAKETDAFEAWERTVLIRISSSLNAKKAPSITDAEKGTELREEAYTRGFSR